MERCFIFQCLCFTLFFIKGTCQNCPKPSGSNCLPIGIGPVSCITKVEDGESLTWFDMQEQCATATGRLLWLSDSFTPVNLAATETSLTGASFATTDFIVIGLVHSMNGDNLNFWRNPDEKKSLSCSTDDTALCMSSSATEKQCNMIGCCWLNGKCQYPEHQWLPVKSGSDAVDTTAISGSSKRNCVGLQRSDKDWTFKAFDCSRTSAANTGYVCQYKCQADWETRTLKNVTWSRSGPTGSSATATGRNGSGRAFDNQAMFTICGVTLVLALYEAIKTFSKRI